jgi:ribosome-associated toxin RatA of RatAB toxin-antitoxin module
MAIIQRKLQVPYHASQMFKLVDDVDQYEQFLPWCKESRVLSRTEDEVRATLTLSAKGLQKSFTTCNRIQKNKMIEISLVNGPFRHLEGFWLFHDQSEKLSTIQFDLEFEFASKFISLAFSPVFHQVANTLIDAFAKRAAELYGS